MTHSSAWTLLILSGLVDIAWAYATKRANGFEEPGWFALSLVLLAIFIILLTKALQALPLGLAYAVWTGIGAIGSVLVGACLLGEPLTPARIGFTALVIIGVAGLRLAS
jgi:quaternary ammonium compound-resistance protein SugE